LSNHLHETKPDVLKKEYLRLGSAVVVVAEV